MTVHQRWQLIDTHTGQRYTFFPNPNAMTSPFPPRNITTKATVAASGQALFIEGARMPVDWQFSGDILDPAQYEALRSWVYDRTGRRIVVADHFGRWITCILTRFDPTPKRSLGKYWRHTYTINATVVSVGPAGVGEVPV